MATEEVLTVEQAVALAFTQNRQAENAASMTPLGAIVRVQSDPNGYAVFVVEEHNGTSIARLRTVEIGDIYGNTIAVTAGLEAGERIIITGATLVSEEEVVRIIP